VTLAAPEPDRYLSLFGVGARGVLAWAVDPDSGVLRLARPVAKAFRRAGRADSAVGGGAARGLPAGLFVLPRPAGHDRLRTHWPSLEASGQALPYLLAHGLPVWLGGLMLAAIFSAEISSADAVLFMISTSVARDLGPVIFPSGMSDAQLLRTGRAAAVVGRSFGRGSGRMAGFNYRGAGDLLQPADGDAVRAASGRAVLAPTDAARRPWRRSPRAYRPPWRFTPPPWARVLGWSPGLAGIAVSVVFFTLLSLGDGPLLPKRPDPPIRQPWA
jgi:hypothetical protein